MKVYATEGARYSAWRNVGHGQPLIHFPDFFRRVGPLVGESPTVLRMIKAPGRQGPISFPVDGWTLNPMALGSQSLGSPRNSMDDSPPALGVS